MPDFSDPFLGTGWSFPPTFDRATSAVQMVSAEADIRESLWVLFSTAKGERVMLPDYGCDIWQYVFRPIDSALIGKMQHAIAQAVLEWEPRISVERVNVYPEKGLVGILLIELDYTVRRTNTRSNLVYPFYQQEGTIAMPGSLAVDG